MIVDTLENSHLYTPKDTPLAKAMEYLSKTDFSKLAPDRYDIDGDNIYAMVLEYDSRPLEGAEFEAHRDYADVHYVRQGTERMGYMNIKHLTVTEPYDKEKDCEMLKGDVDIVTLSDGMFAVVYPEDAHIPCLAVDGPALVKKVVIKIRM